MQFFHLKILSVVLALKHNQSTTIQLFHAIDGCFYIRHNTYTSFSNDTYIWVREILTYTVKIQVCF